MVAVGVRRYAEMCAGCYLAPGMKNSDIHPGLNPEPPPSHPTPPGTPRHATHDPAEADWIVKDHIKASGMSI